MNFTTENIREQIADLLDQCRRLVLSPVIADEAKCAALLADACRLMQQITGQQP